jgi:hypothetical protein
MKAYLTIEFIQQLSSEKIQLTDMDNSRAEEASLSSRKKGKEGKKERRHHRKWNRASLS